MALVSIIDDVDEVLMEHDKDNKIKELQNELESLKSHHEITHSIIEDAMKQSPENGKALLYNMGKLKEQVKGLEELVREVMSWHSDIESPYYNECNIDNQCRWCEKAHYVLSLGKTNATTQT